MAKRLILQNQAHRYAIAKKRFIELLLEDNHLSRNDIFEVIIRHTCEVIPELEGHDFSLNDSLKKLGANSVDRSEIVMLTLESLSINIALIETASAKSIGELANILYEKSQAN